MKRPQSAKPGHKGQWGQSSAQDINDSHPQQHHRKQVRIMKPDLTTHDFARILPRRIQQDKERLYSQGLQLKQRLHEIEEENVRLKTKISVIEKEKEKLNRFVETAPEGLGKMSRLHGGLRISEKDNMVIRNLKKLVREHRQENEILRIDSQKIKKMMKYTKINELQIQRRVLTDENRRLSSILEQTTSQLISQQQLERQNEDLKKYLQQQMDQKNQADQERQKYEEIIESLQDKLRSQSDRFQNKEKRLLRDLNAEKRKTQDLQRRNEELYRQLKILRQNQQYIEQRNNKPVKSTKPQRPQKLNTQPSEPNEADRKYLEVKRQNEELSKQLQSVKEKLQKAESQMSMIQDRSKVNVHHSHLQEDFQDYPPTHPNQKQEDDEQQYQQVFQKEDTKVKDGKQDVPLKESNLKDSRQEDQIEKYKKDFEENQQEQELYKKEEDIRHSTKNDNKKQEKGKQKHSQKSGEKGGEKKKEKKGGKTQYKPNKKLLAEIKELLTYRMKSQRYPFADIKSDIQSAETNVFSYSDLCNMLVNEPFYLTSDYTRAFLAYTFEKDKVEPTQTIPSAVLVAKLRKVIDDFQMMEENEQKEMIIRIAEMTSTYPRELQAAFQNIKNGEETVGRQDLIDMFKKLQLQDKYIDLIIAELSLCSDDLEHLNFHGFFQRFYIQDDGEDLPENNAIEQEQSEQSYRHSSRVKRKGKDQEEVAP